MISNRLQLLTNLSLFHTGSTIAFLRYTRCLASRSMMNLGIA